MTPHQAEVRLFVFRHFVEVGRAPSPAEVAAAFGTTPLDVTATLRALAEDYDAIVLLPDSPYVWMAEPFSAVPTSYVATAGDGRTWFGNCVWDALGILAVVQVDGVVDTMCPVSGTPLQLRVEGGELQPTNTVAHFAVPAHEWWRSIGFT